MIKYKIDSRKVEKNDCFIAIRGNTVDGHDYIKQAIYNGSRTVVVDHRIEDLPPTVYQIVTPDTKKWLEHMLVQGFSDEINEMNLIGITGTNGKTTTAYLTYQMLNKMGEKCAYIGTIGCYIPGMDKIELPNTTPNILDLYDLLLTAKKMGCRHVAMEVSSQGLDMDRTLGLKFQTGLFTNLTQDHLDYHKTMDNYLNCKMKLLDQLEGTMLLNSDDEASNKWKTRYNKCKTYGLNGEIKLISYEDDLLGTSIKVEVEGKEYNIHTNLKGKFNVYNYLSCLSIALESGKSMDEIIKVTPFIYPPKGRCEIIPVNEGIAVVDYAHTPDAVENIINTFNENKTGRIITVIGCGGDRDATKRPIMGNIASTMSDFTIFTNDNPRTEDPVKIMNDILVGTKNNRFAVIYDRKEAIEKAIDLMNPGDVILILGKGHEDYQIIGRTKYHFDDREIVENYIAETKEKNKTDTKIRTKNLKK